MDERKAVTLHLSGIKRIDIEFENIELTVKDGRKGERQILKGISGKFKSGELTAIMGPSGAGKTTLLNILTGFQGKGMKGTIRTNCPSKKEGPKQYKKNACYILQDDQLAPLFTVSEIMRMAADLKMGYGLSKKSKQIAIDDVLDALSLSTCKDTRCGSLSGGQKKRLSIALELLDNPSIMFLDEPTTGLDSSSSLQCISMLKGLARGGRMIICTIHQPSATIYEMFDHVYAMADGCCIYQGASVNTVAYLSSVGLNCPEYHNPADYLLEVANGEYGNFTEQLSKYAQQNNWRNILKSGFEEERGGSDENGNHNNIDLNRSINLRKSTSEWNKFIVLLQRSALQLYRDWTVTHLKLGLHTIIGIFIGLFYIGVGNDGSKTIANISFLIICLVYLCYTSMMPAILRFPSELPILRKETFNNWYALRTYYISFMVVNIPLQIVYCAVYTSISYFMTAQPLEWFRFFMFLSMCCLVTVTSESFGIFMGTIVNPINGTFLGAISLALVLTLAGFLVLLPHMSKAFYMLSFISYLRYGLQGLAQAVYGYGRENLPCPEEAVYCHFTIPGRLLKEFGMSDGNLFWISALVLMGFIICLRIVAFCTLKRCLSRG